MDSDEDFNYVPLKRKKISLTQVSGSEIKRKMAPKNTSTQIPSLSSKKISWSTMQIKKDNHGITNHKKPCESIISISSSDSEISQVYCSNCQMPWKEYLLIGKSKHLHIMACKEKRLQTLKECSNGLKCSFSQEIHFWKFKHDVLCKSRSLILSRNDISESRPTIQPSPGNKNLEMTLHFNADTLTDNESVADLNLEDIIQKKTKSPLKNNKISVCEHNGLVPTTKVENWLNFNCTPNIKGEIKPSCNNNYSAEVVGDSRTCVHFQINVGSASKNLVQSTLDKFFKDPVSSSKFGNEKFTNKSIVKHNDVKDCINSANTIQNWKGILKPNAIQSTSSPYKANSNSISKRLNSNQPGTELNKNKNKNKEKKCPFYKKIEDTSFVVDAFEYGYIDGISSYFLSHFHYDHYQGLHKNFNKNIYCSNITANLIKLKIGVKNQFLRVLQLEETIIIEGIEVTCVDANHCPGAVMFLFALPTGKTILHVGDFRFNPNMESIGTLWSSRLDVLHLDTTFLNRSYDFPSQERILEKVADLAVEHNMKCKNAVFVVGSYTIGKEKVYKTIANILDCKIYANPDKIKILKCLDDEEINKRLTSKKSEAKVHIVPMWQIHERNLEQYVNSLGRQMVGIGICPTGWKHNSSIADNLENLQPRQTGNIYIYDIPYSEHSSFDELERFVKFVMPVRIIPTVNNGTNWQRKEMDNILASWSKQSRKVLSRAYKSHSQM